MGLAMTAPSKGMKGGGFNPLGAVPLIGGALGMIGQRKRENRQFNRTKDLMNLQFGNQKNLNEQAHQLSMDMWKKTNYPAQMEMLREAGLNPSLIYGAGGSGGSTTSSGSSGGSATGGSVGMMPMETAAMVDAATKASQIAVNKSIAKKNDAEARSISGEEGTVGGSQVAANLAGALNAKSQAALNKLGLEIGTATKGDQIDKVFYEVEQLSKQNDLTVEQTNLAKEQAITLGVDRQLKRANIDLSKAQINKMVADIKQGWQKLSNDLQQYGIMNQANKLRALEGKTEVDKIRQDFILGVIGKEIDLHKLNLEQQKVFASMFNGLLGSAASAVRQPSQTVIMPKR